MQNQWLSMKVWGLLFGTIAVLSCGIVESKYVNYQEVEDEGEEGGEAPTECETAALALFTTNVHAPIVTDCAISGCHTATGTAVAGEKLSEDSIETNRTVIKAYTGADPEKLFDKISAKPSHSGGDKSDKMPLADIKAWTDKEAECDAEGA